VRKLVLPVVGWLLTVLTVSALAGQQHATKRKYCLSEFIQDIRTPEWTDHFVGFDGGGEYCLTLDTRAGTFVINGSGRRGKFSKTYLKPQRDPHDPQKMLSGTTSYTEWILTPDSLHGTYYISGDRLELSFQGNPWDWADITTLDVSKDGRTLSTNFRLNIPTVHTISISRWNAVELQ